MKKLIFGCILISTSSLASALNLNVQREIFTESLYLQEQEEWKKANLQINSLVNYPLAYIAEFNYLNANISEASDQDILHFLEENKAKAVSYDLLHTYLSYLAKERRWEDFLIASPQMPNDSTLQCYYLQASIAQGKKQHVWPEAKELWLTKTKLPEACDNVYSFYEKENTLTQEDIWQRFLLAYKRNQPKLIKALIPKLHKNKSALAKKLYSLYKNPKKLTKSHLFKHREDESFPFLINSINRLTKKDISKAMQTYAALRKKVKFTDDEKKQIKSQFAKTILQRRITWLFHWLDKELVSLGNTSLIEQRIRYAIKKDDWKNIDRWVKNLPEDKRNSAAWLYWQARVLEHKGDAKKATEVYKKVAKIRSFHGFMAAQKLKINFPFNADLIEENQDSLQKLDKELSLIEELLFHQLNQQAKEQWARLLNKQTPEVQQQLGFYAYEKGWAHLSILASINSKSWDALNIRFPNVKPNLFEREAEKYDLEDTYIYAITRRESSFDEQAKSPVGATGYMQLMPRTAKETARKIKLKEYKEAGQLNQGNVNVQLGTAYFNGLLKYYKGNRLLATAAYNAGPNRVNKWLSSNKTKGIKMDSWVESIPYHETRAYVKSILVYNVIYQHILDKPLKFLKKEELLKKY